MLDIHDLRFLRDLIKKGDIASALITVEKEIEILETPDEPEDEGNETEALIDAYAEEIIHGDGT